MKNKILNFEEKQGQLYYESDIWDLTNHPNIEISDVFKKKFLKFRSLDFSNIKSDNKKSELKLFFKAVLQRRIRPHYDSKRITHYFGLIQLANAFSEDSFLDVEIDELKKLYSNIIKDMGISQEALTILSNVQTNIYELTDTRTGFDRDIWHLDNYKINAERKNESSPVKIFNFRKITNPTNRDYVKIWAKYLLGCTEFAISTILNKITDITIFLNEFETTNASDITSDDVTILIDDWKEDKSKELINGILITTMSFYKYWEVREESRMKSPVLQRHLSKTTYIPADNLVSENVILQIFRNLHTLPLQERTMFLINYSAGLRISDVCQIKSKDCLYYDDNDGHYVTYYCQKMQKPQLNLIPPSLYKMIQEQQKVIGNDSEYLFPSPTNPNKPMRTGVFANRINTWVKQCEIKNDDGTPYKYRSHAYRHTLATDLLQNYNVDMQVIQLAVLQHQEIQMSLTYAQRGDNYNRALHDKYISNYGEFKSMDFSDADGLQKKALGNGYCNYPERLGTCPYSDVCLNCSHFRTSKQFLDIHKKHLAEVRKNIVLFETNGWLPNLATAKNTEKTLIRIIDTLEKI